MSIYQVRGIENRKECEGEVVVLSQMLSQLSPGGTAESYASHASE
jgi:hypothetical protein